MLSITTSWDDGDSRDMRLAALLESYGVKGTFYITRKYCVERLTDDAIRSIATYHEVGAHTLTHPDLRRLSYEEQMQEIAGSKEWLEEVLGREVEMFCYPSGYYNKQAIAVVQDAGFFGARTVAQGRITKSDTPFEMQTTLQVYPLPLRRLPGGGFWWGNLFEPLVQRYGALRSLHVPVICMTSWQRAARAAFDYAYENGDIFHLWGHSWELEQYGMWDELERFLRYITDHKNVQFVVNSELV